MKITRKIIRRALEVIAVLGSAGSCVGAGIFSQMIAQKAPITSGHQGFEVVPKFTNQVLSIVPYYPTIGWCAAITIVVVALATFRISQNEDTRIQVILLVSVVGYSVALQMTLAIGVGLVLIPAMANGI